MKTRFILRYRGERLPDADAERIAQAPGVVVVERAGRMVLVEGDDRDVHELAASLDGWVLAPEQTISVPDTRKQVRRPPS